MRLPEKINALRRERRWNYSELARATGIPQPTIWRLERGVIEHPKADTLIALANAFKIPVDYLIKDEYQLNPSDLLRTDNDIRTIIEIYSSLSQDDKQAVKRFAQSLSHYTSAEEKRRYVSLAVKTRRVRKE